ncbi:MAG: serine hydrolase [Planctomycetes bacterium]|nr:serine hydrolase [Planctomycetota bacterium]
MGRSDPEVPRPTRSRPPLPPRAALAGVLVLLAACATKRPVLGDLESELRALAEPHAGRRIALVYLALDGGAEIALDPDASFHAASTMKLAVMIEAFRRADAGDFDLEAQLPVHDEFASIVDGSPYSLSAGDDSDPELFEARGATRSARELVTRMIRRSSNLATNLLIERLDARRVQAGIEALGATHGMQVRRGVEDGKAFRAGLNNVATARDLAVLLRAIARGEAASAASCRAMLEILAGQEFRTMIPAGLPDGTVVAHKTGSITRIAHDAAIVDPFGPSPYVLVVLTAGFDDEGEACAAGAEFARRVHAAHLAQCRT